jgi:hypothetical protein
LGCFRPRRETANSFRPASDSVRDSWQMRSTWASCTWSNGSSAAARAGHVQVDDALRLGGEMRGLGRERVGGRLAGEQPAVQQPGEAEDAEAHAAVAEEMPAGDEAELGVAGVHRARRIEPRRGGAQTGGGTAYFSSRLDVAGPPRGARSSQRRNAAENADTLE